MNIVTYFIPHNFLLIFGRLSSNAKYRFLISFFLVLSSAIIELSLAGAIGLFGIAITDPEQLIQLEYLKYLISCISPFLDQTSTQNILIIILFSFISSIILFKNIIRGISVWWQERLSGLVAREFGTFLFNAYLNMPYVWHVLQNTSKLQTHIDWCVNFSVYLNSIIALLTGSIASFALSGAALYVTPKTSSLVFGITSLVALSIYVLFRKKIHLASSTAMELQTNRSRIVMESLQCFQEISIYKNQSAFSNLYDHYGQLTERVLSLRSFYQAVPPLILEFVGVLMLLIALIIIIVSGSTTAYITGTFALMVGTTWRMIPAINNITLGITTLRAINPYIEFLLSDIQAMKPISRGTIELVPFNDNIRLNNIDFTYPEALKPALKDISITISKGKMVGIVGLSGAGKSTLVSILTGLLQPTNGALEVDSTPLSTTQLEGWTQIIGYVPQSAFLIDATLAENVAFKDWGQEIDREKVTRCCRMAAMNFLDQLPLGLETILGQRGLRLSGGQAQRVSIARALYNDPQVIIFDEATSALDGAAEEAIQQTILSLRESITMIIIAHRLTSVRACDYIYWLEAGSIKRHGTPDVIIPDYEEYLRNQPAFSTI